MAAQKQRLLGLGGGINEDRARGLEDAGDFGAQLLAQLVVEIGERLIEQRLAGGRPVLGICVGMQVLFERGVEFGEEAAGAGQWPGTVEKLQAPVLPHMGWNTVDAPADSVLFAGMAPDTRFYFVHSFAARRWEQEAPEHFRPALVTWAHHGEDFVAAVENGPLAATQFHPEKSGDAGAELLSNWLGALR